MGDTVTGEEPNEVPENPEDMLRQVKSDVSISEVHHEVERAIIDKEELETAASTMESIYHTAITFEHDADLAKGMHLACAKVVGDAIENPAYPLGYYNANPEASMESFVSTLSDTIEKIWRAIINVYNKISQAIRSFLKNLFGGVANLRRWSERLQKQLDDMDGSEEMMSVGIALSKPGKLAIEGELTRETLLNGASNVNNVLVAKYDAFIEDTRNSYENLANWFKKKDAGKIDTLRRMVQRDNEQRETIYEKIVDKIKLPGDYTIKVLFGGSTKDFPMPTRYEVVKSENAKDFRGRGTLPGLDRNQVQEQLDIVNNIIDVIERHEKSIEDIEKLRDETKEAADKWVDEAEKGVLEGELTKMDVRSALRISTNNTIKGLISINKYLYDYTSAYMEALEKSLERYK